MYSPTDAAVCIMTQDFFIFFIDLKKRNTIDGWWMTLITAYFLLNNNIGNEN